ncbi:MAG TPA: hypothetical protein PLJ62_04640 [Thermoflexales bacterium]|nr:hypothetical protein [Thermoflexales bacterium]HQW36996.1 hypothetical protein [Thermoflexales bacterium]HQZ21821.1 hypothetical protein [Thermoflexales bacterium]HQZ99465.1 hypothetical protein [Thermoflexales bacterium]
MFSFKSILLNSLSFSLILVALSGCGAAQTPSPAPAPVAQPTALPTTPPTAQAAPTAAPSATAAPAAGSAAKDLTPAGITVWNTEVGASKQTGTCNNGPILPVYGLAQITVAGDSLGWKDQQAEFAMKKIQPSVWQYEGDNKPVPGKLRLTVTFVDDKTLSVLRELIPQNDSACTQAFTYKGVFQWAK